MKKNFNIFIKYLFESKNIKDLKSNLRELATYSENEY